MIGIDTNILLRLWLNDDPARNKRIDALLTTHGGMPGSLLVTDVVLAEAVWARKAAFEQDKRAQLIAVRSLLAETAFAFEDREAVVVACSKQAHADSPTAWSSQSMLDRVATSPQPSIEGATTGKSAQIAGRTAPRVARWASHSDGGPPRPMVLFAASMRSMTSSVSESRRGFVR